jgi:SnoaL-like domain
VSDPRIARLLDERALRRCAELYAQGADRRDKTLWASIVTEDCVIEGPGLRLAGRANITAALDIMATLYTATQHRVHNQVVTIEGDSAEGETYSTADHLRTADGVTTLLAWAIRYQDRWRREDGAWRFSHRRLVIDWTETRTL